MTCSQIETGVIDALLARGEKRLHQFAHPDPYIGKCERRCASGVSQRFWALTGGVCFRSAVLFWRHAVRAESPASTCEGKPPSNLPTPFAVYLPTYSQIMTICFKAHTDSACDVCRWSRCWILGEKSDCTGVGLDCSVDPQSS